MKETDVFLKHIVDSIEKIEDFTYSGDFCELCVLHLSEHHMHKVE